MKLNIFYLLMLIAIFPPWVSRAQAVILGHERGGGHPVVFEFQRAFRSAAKILKEKAPDLLTKTQWQQLESKAREAKYVVANEDVVVVHDGIHSHVVAANDVKTQTVTIDVRGWRALGEPTLAAAMAIHEIASLAGLEGAGRYSLSARFVELSDAASECSLALQPSVPASVNSETAVKLVKYANLIAELERIGLLTLVEAKAGVFETVVESDHSPAKHVYDWMVMERLTLRDGRQFIFDPLHVGVLKASGSQLNYKTFSREAYPAPYPHTDLYI